MKFVADARREDAAPPPMAATSPSQTLKPFPVDGSFTLESWRYH
ncbi:hypothetical protein [Ruegeria atlantica]|nr:hypothetical protein [Ruegeria atlantica]